MSGWYVKVEGTGPLGPLPTEQVSQGVATGQLRQDVLVRTGGTINVQGASGALGYDPVSEETSAEIQVWVIGTDATVQPAL